MRGLTSDESRSPATNEQRLAWLALPLAAPAAPGARAPRAPRLPHYFRIGKNQSSTTYAASANKQIIRNRRKYKWVPIRIRRRAECEVGANSSVGSTQINVRRCVCRNLLRCLLDALRAYNVNIGETFSDLDAFIILTKYLLVISGFIIYGPRKVSQRTSLSVWSLTVYWTSIQRTI